MKSQNIKKKSLISSTVKALFLKKFFIYFSIFVCQIEVSLSFVLYLSKNKYKYGEEKFHTTGLKIQPVR